MRVLVLFTYGYSLKSWNESGTLERELSIYKQLNSEKNVSFTFLTYGNESDENFNLSRYGIDVVPIYKNIKKSRYKLTNYFQSFLVPFYFKKKLKNIDIIKQNQLLGSWTALILKLLLKKPLFLRTGYDMYQFSILDEKSKIIQFMYKLLTKFSIKFSNLYTVSSNSDLDFLNKKFKINKKLLIRPNWVIPTDYVNLEKRSENKILAIGRLEHQKNFQLLIDSFGNKNYQIDIIGNGTMKNTLIELAKKKNCEVNFIDKKDFTELMETTKNYKYFISTSLFEGNPKSLLDAMSNGCICFVTDIPNHKEIIKNNFNGYIYNQSKNNLIETFEKNLDNPTKLNSISKNAYKHVHDTYSLSNAVNIENDDYNKLTKTT